MMKLPVTFVSGIPPGAALAAAEAAGDGLKVTGTLSPGAGEPSVPAGEVPGAIAGDIPVAGEGIAAPG